MEPLQRVEEIVSESIERILRSDVLLPVNPLKLFAQSLMRNEMCQGNPS